MRTDLARNLSDVIARLPGWLPATLAWAITLFGVMWLLRALWRDWQASRGAGRRTLEVDAFRGTRRDPLTGLPNRQCFTDALAGRMALGVPSALLLLDLDDFASLNSSFGHRAGDEVLIAVADRLRMLAPAPNQLGRLGEDEFAVLLEATGGSDFVEAEALRLLRATMQPLRAGQQTLTCSISVGVALAPAHGSDADALLHAAHSALGEVKESGGGAWRLFDPVRQRAEQARTGLRDELRLAIGNGQMLPFYQPIMDLVSNQLVGLEVLARWMHPTRGLLEPEVFIPIAEDAQLAGQLTQALMRRLLADARHWPTWLYFAFNVAPGQLRELISMVRDPPAWPEGVLDPSRLEIEITESAIMQDVEVAREVIALLHGRGTRVVLDDFGIGTSNFVHMRELPFDRIKIDRSFVIGITHHPRAQACVKAMLALGSSLGADMVAEGVETAESAALIATLGCRFAQGFHYSAPVPADGVPTLLRRLSASPIGPSRRVAC